MEERRDERRDVGWKEWTEGRLADLEKQLNLHVRYSEQALGIAKDAADRRNQAENFVREQLREQSATFVPYLVYGPRTDAVDKRLNDLEKSKANMDGRLWALGVFFVALQVALRFLLK